MAKQVDAQAAAAAWVAAMQSSTTSDKYKRGINALQENPMEKAAARVDYWAERVAASKQRYQDKLRSASFATYKANAIGTGAQRLSSGATKAKPKVDKHFSTWAPIYSQASAAAGAIQKHAGHANAVERFSAAVRVLMEAAGRA